MNRAEGENQTWEPFARLTGRQREQLDTFAHLLLGLNNKINLISQDTAAHFAERHLLHTLALTRKTFPPGSSVVDWGTGGGLPAIPLAICFPDSTVYAVDAVRKKIQAVRTMARRLGLQNLQAWHGRAEQWPGTVHYSVSRATAPLRDLWSWHTAVYSAPPFEGPASSWKPGLICLKGGELSAEITALAAEDPSVHVQKTPLRPLLDRLYFDNKYLLEIYRP